MTFNLALFYRIKKMDLVLHWVSSLQLFSSALPQNGEDSEGILGFLISDIQQELKRGKQLVSLLKFVTFFCTIDVEPSLYGWLTNVFFHFMTEVRILQEKKCNDRLFGEKMSTFVSFHLWRNTREDIESIRE